MKNIFQGKDLLFELEAKLDLYSSRKIITRLCASLSAHISEYILRFLNLSDFLFDSLVMGLLEFESRLQPFSFIYYYNLGRLTVKET